MRGKLMVRIAILSNRYGFTLIEFCVSVVIMMVGVLGLLQAVNMATSHNLNSVIRNDAVSLCDEQMVILKSSVINDTAWQSLASSSVLVNRKMRGGFANYSVISQVAVIRTDCSKSLDMRVAWRFKGSKNAHTMSSIVVNPDASKCN